MAFIPSQVEAVSVPAEEESSPKKKQRKSKEIYRGPPTEDFLNNFEGWTQAVVERSAKDDKTRQDKQWYSPGGKLFRSKIEVLKFLSALKLPDVN